MKRYIVGLLFIFTSFYGFSQTVVVSGYVTDEKGLPLDIVYIGSTDNTYNTVADSKGFYSISIPKTIKTLVFRDYNSEVKFVEIKHTGNDLTINVTLDFKDKLLDDVVVNESKLNSTGLTYFDPKIITVMPSVSGGIEKMIIMGGLGTHSTSELSSQYTVRGGNYDENLVYVNGIEIYRPQLIRSGQQEGLSFINPSMVSSVKFSAGGFEAKYGDKMSSVLDIRYRRPTKFGAEGSMSLLGASAFVEGVGFKGKFKHITGLRYKTNRYILNSLETKGQYKPSFVDLQTFLTYSLNSKFDFNFLGNYSANKFNFIPESQETSFGTISESYGLFIWFEGLEKDKFNTFTGAFTGDFHPNKNTKLTLTTSGFQTEESETYDIVGYYSLNELNRDIGSQEVGDSVLSLGVGKFINHARNILYINSYNLSHTGLITSGNHNFNWGINGQRNLIKDKLNEWKLIDSAGYSVPYNGSSIILSESFNAKNTLNTTILSAFIQDSYNYKFGTTSVEITGGLRCNYNDYNQETLLSPRFSAAISPETTNSHIFRISTGVYYQPPFYRELRTHEGNLTKNSKAQRSIHFLVGNEFNFKALGREFKMISELYYKKLDNLIPYEVDNVRVRYYANQRSRGYATGIDTKISGEFVSGVDSWFSVSFMKTEEDIYDIGNGQGDGYGYIARPSNQLFNLAIFFQDYLPGNKNFKANLTLTYGSGLPFGPPNTERAFATGKMPSYKRVDLGFSAVLVREDKIYKNRIIRRFKSIWLTGEIFNLLGVNNTISYLWIQVVPNTSIAGATEIPQYAVPNHLTARMLNIKLTANF